MSVAGQSQFRKHRSPRILQNEVRETPSIPVRRVRKDVLLDERHALLPSPTSKSYFRWGHCSQSRGCQHFRDFPDRRDCLEQSPAGSRRQPKCVVDSITEGSPASLPKSFKPTSFARSRATRRRRVGSSLRSRSGLGSGPSTVTGRRSYRNTHALFRDLSKRMNFGRLPLIITDGFEFYQKVIRRLIGPACLYGQVLKTRRNGRIIKAERRALHGAAWRFDDALNNSEDSSTLNTSFIERLNLTIRQSSAYLSRHLLGDDDSFVVADRCFPCSLGRATRSLPHLYHCP